MFSFPGGLQVLKQLMSYKVRFLNSVIKFEEKTKLFYDEAKQLFRRLSNKWEKQLFKA